MALRILCRRWSDGENVYVVLTVLVQPEVQISSIIEGSQKGKLLQQTAAMSGHRSSVWH